MTHGDKGDTEKQGRLGETEADTGRQTQREKDRYTESRGGHIRRHRETVCVNR